MKDANAAELIGVIEKNLRNLDGIRAALHAALDHDVRVLGRTDNAALIVAGHLERYYTCLETVFLRISQIFENNLAADRWHADLLEKMTLRIEGIRMPAVSEANQGNLLELLKFRHFRRYYFEAEFEWDRLDLLVRTLDRAHPMVKRDLAGFTEFLWSL
jgi:hypothetical protein